MKRIATFLLLPGIFCFAEDVTLTKPAILRADRSMISLKAGTVVELVGRDEKLVTVRHGKITGTIPAGSIAGTAAVEAKKGDAPRPTPPPAAPAKKAGTMYGKAVEKAKENAARHDKNVARPVDEILQ